jgi:hypothetical protein
VIRATSHGSPATRAKHADHAAGVKRKMPGVRGQHPRSCGMSRHRQSCPFPAETLPRRQGALASRVSDVLPEPAESAMTRAPPQAATSTLQSFCALALPRAWAALDIPPPIRHTQFRIGWLVTAPWGRRKGEHMIWDKGLRGPALRIAGTTRSPLRVVAGPGTGKTFALMRRVTRLLERV